MPTRHDGTPREVRALNAFITLMRASDTVFWRLERALGPREMNQTQLGVLEALLHLGRMNQRELGKKLLKSAANMTAVLDGLESRGLVTRERSAEDRRSVTVDLTPAGRRLIRAVFREHMGRIVEMFSALTAEEQEELRRLCKKLGLAAREIESREGRK